MRANGTTTPIRFAVGMLFGILAMALLAPTAQAVEGYTFNALPPVVVESVRESVDTTYETEQYLYDDAEASKSTYSPLEYDFNEDDGEEALEVSVEVESGGFTKTDGRPQGYVAPSIFVSYGDLPVGFECNGYADEDVESLFCGLYVEYENPEGDSLYTSITYGGEWLDGEFDSGINPNLELILAGGAFVFDATAECFDTPSECYLRTRGFFRIGVNPIAVGGVYESGFGVGVAFRVMPIRGNESTIDLVYHPEVRAVAIVATLRL